MVDWLRYSNQGATRNRPLDPRLVQALSFLPKIGVTAEVFSGGQPAAGGGPRVGSVRHDHGGAGDMFFYRGGRRLDWNNAADRAVFEDIVRQGKAAGITGFGAGPGYMQQGSMHVGFGSPGVWGAGGKGRNAPAWLQAAYNGAPAGTAPAAPTASLADMYADPAAPAGIAEAVAAPGAVPLDEPTFGGLALMFAQQQQDARRAREEREATEEEQRRVALLTSPRRRGLAGFYA